MLLRSLFTLPPILFIVLVIFFGLFVVKGIFKRVRSFSRIPSLVLGFNFLATIFSFACLAGTEKLSDIASPSLAETVGIISGGSVRDPYCGANVSVAEIVRL